MGNNIPATLTNCTFPFTNYPNTNSSSCDKTYAQASGTSYTAFWLFNLIYCWICVAIQCYALPKIFKKFWPGVNWSNYHIPDPLIWNSAATLTCIMAGLVYLDMWGWRNAVRIQVYTITDQLAGFITYMIVIDVISAWKRAVSMLRGQGLRSGFPVPLKLCMGFVVFIGSVGAEIAGIADPSHYKTYAGAGQFFLATLMSFLFVQACTYIRDIFFVLKSASGGGSKNKGNLRMMQQKFIAFSIPALAVTCIWIWNGAVNIAAHDQSWSFAFEPKFGASLVFSRVVLLIVVTGLTFFFANPFPPSTTSSSESSTKMMHGTGNARAISSPATHTGEQKSQSSEIASGSHISARIDGGNN